MNIKWILTAISILVFAGPICAALVIYQGNLTALVMPKNIESLISVPGFEYRGYDINAPLKPVLKFKIVNPYNINLKLNSMEAEVFCSDDNTLLGSASEIDTVSVPAKSSKDISLALDFTSQGMTHIYTNHVEPSGLSFSVVLKNLALNIQGIELSSGQQIGPVGPIQLTP